MPEENFIDELDTLLTSAGIKVFDEDTPEEFLEWFRSAAPVIAPNFCRRISDVDLGDPIYNLGVFLWNHFPQPSNQWKPLPLKRTTHNQMCPCQSGKRYRNCCAHLPDPSAIFDRLNLLRFVLETSPKGYLKTLNAVEMDPFALSDTCYHWINRNQSEKARILLEPLFRIDREPPLHGGMLLDTLLEAWPAWYKPRKRMQLLDELIKNSSPEISTVALQCKVSVLADQGDRSAAWVLFGEGLRRYPEDVNFAALEITLLLAEGRRQEARMRTAFWCKVMDRKGGDYQAYKNRLEMLVERRSDLAFLDEITGTNPEFGDLIHALRTEPLRTEGFKNTRVDNMFCLELTDEFRELLPIDTNTFEQLTKCYRKDPRLLSNFIFLLVLNNAVYHIEHNDLTTGSIAALIYNRGEWLLYSLLDDEQPVNPQIGDPPNWEKLIARPLPEVPWMMPENRPALGMMDQLIDLLANIFWRDDARALTLMQLMLKLNPNDNHGYRTPLSSALLKQGEADKVLDLLNDYDDDFAPVRMNRVLALWLTDQKKKAAELFLDGGNDVREIRRAILNKRYARPKDADNSFVLPGGKSEAWRYRNDMQALWQEVGAINWLKSQPIP